MVGLKWVKLGATHISNLLTQVKQNVSAVEMKRVDGGGVISTPMLRFDTSNKNFCFYLFIYFFI